MLMCDAHDIGLSVKQTTGAAAVQNSRATDTPRIFIYDAYPGGIGFSEPLFAMHGDLLHAHAS